jgi:hypothetical protein
MLRLGVVLACLLLPLPASAGLLGTTVMLNGVATTVGDGIEFQGLNSATGQPFTADFSNDGLTITIDNRVAGQPDLLNIPFSGTPFLFTFASPILNSVALIGGTIVSPASAAPPESDPCAGTPPGEFCTGFVNVLPQMVATTLAFSANSIGMSLSGGMTFRTTDTAMFSIQTVPAPASAPVLLVGLAALGAAGRLGRRPKHTR